MGVVAPLITNSTVLCLAVQGYSYRKCDPKQMPQPEQPCELGAAIQGSKAAATMQVLLLVEHVVLV